MATIVPIVKVGKNNKNVFPIATAYNHEKKDPATTFPIKDWSQAASEPAIGPIAVKPASHIPNFIIINELNAEIDW